MNNHNLSLLIEDLEHVREYVADLKESLQNAHIFITGATGFFGIWLLESLLYLKHAWASSLRITALSRNPEAFLTKHPYFKGAIDFWQGDVRCFEFPRTIPSFTHIIHGATSASAALTQENPREMFTTIVHGTERVLELAKKVRDSLQAFLYVSSGAVYGELPQGSLGFSEEFYGAVNTLNPQLVYHEGKRAGEMLCALAFKEWGAPCKIARCFAFVGPYLPLRAHFAIGNFIADALSHQDIMIEGDGTPVRSYLYAADLVVWLLSILVKGAPLAAYNVGSEHALSIRELAYVVAHVAARYQRHVKVHVAKSPDAYKSAHRYVPVCAKARDELGLCERISLESALERTFTWLMQHENFWGR